MSDARVLPSPDQRYHLVLINHEMRMSHWVTEATLWKRDPSRLLLQLGDGLWSCEEATWGADSRWVTVRLRRYPGDTPGIMLDLYPEQQIVIPHPPAEAQPLPFAQLTTFLAR
jgi:hypothetical protein